ncbi:MAG: YicC family protein [Deltaproteobacteria bacterium]|nr:YicC family protein [Deltaproteobacteria bacterium]
MIKSMTGYGRGEWHKEGKRIAAEVKSFNHRYCDILIHLPRRLNALEGQARKSTRERFARGRIEISVQVEDASQAEQRLGLDLPLAREYHRALKGLQESLGVPGEIRLDMIAAYRDIFTRMEEEVDLQEEWTNLQIALEGAFDGLERMRRAEGAVLREEFLRRLQEVKQLLGQIEEKGPSALEAARHRLADRVQELSGGLKLDPARLAQEVAILAERSDITEELVRIHSHLGQFREMLDHFEPMGRKLDFLLQEINREANTIGSKSSDAAIAQLGVEIKSELEKMREQVQNVE